MQEYPKYKYNQNQDPIIVESFDEESELDSSWVDSPADYGVETCPGVAPDPTILAINEEIEDEKPVKGGASK